MKTMMTESEWNTSGDPYRMLKACRRVIRRHPRKGHLFAVVCCRRIWHLLTDPRSREAVEAASHYVEGLVPEEHLRAAADGAEAAHASAFRAKGKIGAAAEWAAQCAASSDAWAAAGKASNFAYVAAGDGLEPGPEHDAQADLLRCIFGPLPFRTVTVEPSWSTPAVVALARVLYDEQAFHRMAEIGITLERAGCVDADVLAHTRLDAPHVRGCWVLDLILGKE